MICLMHEGAEYGYLKVGSKVILPDNLARMVGATLQETEGWLDELVTSGVVSVDESGCYYCRRMIKDELVRASRAAGGSKGGNPALTNHDKDNQKDTGKVGDKVNLPPNLSPTPSSSSAFASAKKEKEDGFSFAENTSEGTPEGDRLTMPGGLSAWSEQFWAVYPKKVKRNEIDEAMDRAVIEIVHRKSVCDDVAFAEIMEAARAYAESPMGRLSAAQSIPSPALWLKQGCYRDDRQLWQTPLGETAKPRDVPRPKVAPLVGDQLMKQFGAKQG